MKDFLETGTNALVVGLILIAVYVLYQRLLKAVGKGRYENFYLELMSHSLDWELLKLQLVVFISKRETVKIQILNSKKEEVMLLHEGELPYGEYSLETSIDVLTPGQYITKITSETQVLTRYFKVK